MSDKEELNKEKLDSLKDAFDDLEIIDVERKPEILVSNLKQGNEFFSNLKDGKKPSGRSIPSTKGLLHRGCAKPQRGNRAQGCFQQR